jgi:hypothetical protein
VAHHRKRWSGEYIIVWSDDTWEFFRWCRCGKLLEEAASRTNGLGSECVKQAGADAVWGVQDAEHKKMRVWLKRNRMR